MNSIAPRCFLTNSLHLTNYRKFTPLEAKTPMCDSDIDSSHQKPSNEMSNSSKRRSSSGQIRLLMLISFAIYVLTKSLHLTNYGKFTPLEAQNPQCVIVISIPLIKSRRMRCRTPQKHGVHRARYGSLCLLASLSMY
jgi:hypothetical protein